MKTKEPLKALEEKLQAFRAEMQIRHTVAAAWRLAWMNEEYDDGPPDPCEGCAHPSVTRDVEGVPLCQLCSDACIEDDSVQEAAPS